MIYSSRVVVVACGRRDSGDDALGILIGEEIARRSLPDARVVLTESPGVDLIAEMEGAEMFILIDAARATPAHLPGTWERIDYRATPEVLRARLHAGTHDLGVAETLALADRLGSLPSRVAVYAVFGEHFDWGAPLTEAALAGIRHVVDGLEHEVLQFIEGGSPVVKFPTSRGHGVKGHTPPPHPLLDCGLPASSDGVAGAAGPRVRRTFPAHIPLFERSPAASR